MLIIRPLLLLLTSLIHVGYLQNWLFLPLNASNLNPHEQPDSVLSSFQKFGFSKAHISKMIKKYPLILKCKAEKTISPKLEFFRSKGASTPDLVNMFSVNPKIVTASLENRLVRTFDILVELFQSESKAIEVVCRNPWVLYNNPESGLAPYFNILRENGVPASNILRLFCFRHLWIGSNLVKFRKTVEGVKEMGFNPLNSQFAVATMVMTVVSKSKMDRRVGVYKRWGLSDEDIATMFKKHPWCLSISEDKLMQVFDFYVNKLGLDSSVIVNHPVLLSYSLKKRLIPRGAVIQYLCSKGLLDMDSSIAKLFICKESRFLEKYVKCQEEAPFLVNLYNEKLHETICEGERKS